ncbi:MAG: type II toxin-antitoxin system HicA family toxin [Candidatus Zambryskibacteria bacterium]|nr:type II toxin-antitoxin system HicA family toxin [Candidatus Zambryskibacteria bacterium]
MPKLYSSKHIISVLEKNGFYFVSQKGSHIKMRKEKFTVIIPARKRGIPIGTFKSILRQSGLNQKDFEK